MDNRTYTQAERLELITSKLTGGNKEELARRIGIVASTITRIAKEEKTLTAYYADKIVAVFPTVNRDFLLTGRGYPGDLSVELVRSKYESILADKDRLIETLRREIEIQQEMIDRLK